MNISDVVASQIGEKADLSLAERTPRATQELGQQEFFKLLTTQLASQDPMKPMEDTAFIAQMAQFSALEAQGALNTSFDNFSESQSFTSAQNMIGKHVSFTVDGKQLNGIAEGVERDDGTIRVFVDHDGDGTASGYNINTVNRVNVASMQAETGVVTGESDSEATEGDSETTEEG